MSGGWRFAWSSVPGITYAVESSTDLNDWRPVTQVTAVSSATEVLASASAGQPSGFFRARVIR